MFCPYCGFSVAENQAFCHNCGKKILSPKLDNPSLNCMETFDDSKSLSNKDFSHSIPTQMSLPHAPSININLSQNQTSPFERTFSSPNAYVESVMKSKETTGILCILLGCFGAHDLYVGKIGIGVTKIILTFTFIGYFITAIWQIVDLICILNGNYRDHLGRPLIGNAPVTKVLVFIPMLFFIIVLPALVVE